ncbi:MAG: SIR2 family NAD-dependent protein deacylase [Collinsella sp.]
MYSGGFYPFPDVETLWAWWSRHIYFNRYDVEPGRPYLDLLKLVKDKDYFVITTNVDHQFQLAGFDKHRLFYTQGDYGLFQCSGPCSQVTYDNEEAVRAMMEQQKGMRIPSELVPTCPKCGRPMTTNLRVDGRFVEDKGWHAAATRYDEFCRRHAGMHVLYLELGVGMNTPVIIKYPFWNAVDKNPKAIYACVSLGEACAPKAVNKRSILIDGDIGMVLSACVS